MHVQDYGSMRPVSYRYCFAAPYDMDIATDDRRRLQSFHIQHQLPGIKWHFFIRKTDIADTTGLPSIQEIIDNRRFALFGHVVRLCARIPAQQALKFSIATRSGHRPNARWSKTPVCPHSSWKKREEKSSKLAMEHQLYPPSSLNHQHSSTDIAGRRYGPLMAIFATMMIMTMMTNRTRL